ncbi:MAG: hypothetical protein QM730_29525 [Anaerolineales bacterium]
MRAISQLDTRLKEVVENISSQEQKRQRGETIDLLGGNIFINSTPDQDRFEQTK